jgi:uncharacterized membrane protein YebE (DUF533 family)
MNRRFHTCCQYWEEEAMDLNKIVSSLASSGVLGGFAGGAVGGALMSNKKARKTAGTLLKVGGIAALGGVAWKAYQGYQSSQNQAGPAAVDNSAGSTGQPQRVTVWGNVPEQRFALEEQVDPGRDSPSLLLVQAMIAAACADNHIDVDERQRIMSRVDELGLAPDETALVFDSLQSPLSLAQLCERIDSPELATEVYLSSLMAVDTGRTEARLYLDALAYRLGLPPALKEQLHRSVDNGQALQVA